MVRIFTPDKNVDMERLCAVDGKQIGAVQSKDLCSKYIYSFFLTSRKKKDRITVICHYLFGKFLMLSL